MKQTNFKYYFDKSHRMGVDKVKRKLYKTKENLAEKLDIPRDIMLSLPKITITGDNEIKIENHKGIILFSEMLVKVNTNCGVISVKGEEFQILFLGGATIILNGKFKSVNYEGGI